MKVHQLINHLGPHDGGAERLVRQLHRGLVDRGVNSQLVMLRGQLEAGADPAMTALGLDRLKSWNAFRAVLKYFREHVADDDIVHAHLFPTNLLASLAARWTRWPGRLLTTEHSTHNRRRTTWGGRRLDATLYRRFDRVYCISEGTREALQAWQPQLAGRLEVIENGIPLVHPQPIERPARETVTVVSIGRLSAIKDYPTAIQAIAQLPDLPVRYLIAGQGDQLRTLEQLISSSGLTDRCQLLGYVTDLTALLSDADLLLHTAKWEGFGLAVAEAMNASLPIVTSDVPGIRELVRGQQDGGTLIPPGDVTSFSTALRTMIEDRGRRLDWGQRAWHRSQHFGIDRMIDRYLAAYQDKSSDDSNIP